MPRDLKAELKYQMEIDENFLHKNAISCFKFDKNPQTMDLGELRALVGFGSGWIRVYKVKNSQHLASINIVRRLREK
jgi:hypothetical protein